MDLLDTPNCPASPFPPPSQHFLLEWIIKCEQEVARFTVTRHSCLFCAMSQRRNSSCLGEINSLQSARVLVHRVSGFRSGVSGSDLHILSGSGCLLPLHHSNTLTFLSEITVACDGNLRLQENKTPDRRQATNHAAFGNIQSGTVQGSCGKRRTASRVHPTVLKSCLQFPQARSTTLPWVPVDLPRVRMAPSRVRSGLIRAVQHTHFRSRARTWRQKQISAFILANCQNTEKTASP